MKSTIPMGLVAAAGKPAEETQDGVKFDALHRSGYQPSLRIADQQRTVSR